MKRWGLIIGPAVLCTAFAVFTAASASAATTGTTAVTCIDTSPTNNGDYTDEHCDTTGTLGASKYKHVTIAQDTPTTIVGTNANTKSGTTESARYELLATIGGVNTAIDCTTWSSVGTLKNSLVGTDPNGDHRITISGFAITYTGCTVTTPSACTVNTPGQAVGTMLTKALKAESIIGTPHTLKFSPEVGTIILEFKIEGCPIAGTYTVTGTFSAEPTGQMAAGGGRGASAGATLAVSLPKNASSTLVVAGQKAGSFQEETIRMSGAGGNPIASTGPPF